MKTTSLCAIAVIHIVFASPIQAGNMFKKLAEELEAAQQKKEAALRKVQVETKKHQDAVEASKKAQKEALQALGDANVAKAYLLKLAETNAAQLERISNERDTLAKEAVNLEYDKRERDLQIQALENEREKLENQQSKLEHQRLILAGSSLAFLVTTGLGLISTRRTWRSAKLEDEKCSLEIVELKRNLKLQSTEAGVPSLPKSAKPN